MLSKALLEKLEQWESEKKEVADQIAKLENEKHPALASLGEAVKSKDLTKVVSAKKAQAALEDRLLALKSIADDIESSYPIDKELFMEERERFIQKHRDNLAGKYDKIVETTKELGRLFTDYDNTYNTYLNEHTPWDAVAKKMGLNSLSGHFPASQEISDELAEYQKFKNIVDFIIEDISFKETRQKDQEAENAKKKAENTEVICSTR